MVVKLKVDMVDMVYDETMRRFFLHSSLHKVMLAKRLSLTPPQQSLLAGCSQFLAAVQAEILQP